MATGRPRFSLEAGAYFVTSVAFAPDGQTLASAGPTGRLMLWQTATGQKLREWQLPGTILRVEFTPDGRHLALGNANGTVYVLRLAAAPLTASAQRR